MVKILPFTLLVFVFTCCLSVSAQDMDRGVVRIKIETEGINKTGSGFIVSITQDAAYIVTAAHVIEGVAKPRVEFFGQPNIFATATVVISEGTTDLAILHVERKDLPRDAKALPLASPNEVLEAGTDIIIIGFPLGQPDWSQNAGKITGRQGSNIAFNAEIGEGSSGSPVIRDRDKQVLGIVTSVEIDSRQAVPVDTLHRLLNSKGIESSAPSRRGLIPDFPGGSRRAYSAEFDKWPTPTTGNGSITLGFGNSYVMRPASNIWIGPGKLMEITPLNQDFVLDMKFRVESRNPSAVVSLELSGAATDADDVNVYLELWNQNSATYSITKGRIRSGALPVPHAIPEESIAERAELPAVIKSHDWSKGGKITLKREAGEMQLFVNDIYVKDFHVSVFPVDRLGVGAAFSSTILITSIEARTKM
jgi:trypsin-like peptidase